MSTLIFRFEFKLNMFSYTLYFKIFKLACFSLFNYLSFIKTLFKNN